MVEPGVVGKRKKDRQKVLTVYWPSLKDRNRFAKALKVYQEVKHMPTISASAFAFKIIQDFCADLIKNNSD